MPEINPTNKIPRNSNPKKQLSQTNLPNATKNKAITKAIMHPVKSNSTPFPFLPSVSYLPVSF
jgi:hypothetical protein